MIIIVVIVIIHLDFGLLNFKSGSKDVPNASWHCSLEDRLKETISRGYWDHNDDNSVFVFKDFNKFFYKDFAMDHNVSEYVYNFTLCFANITLHLYS